MESRGGYPVHQAELSPGGHLSPHLSKTPEHDRSGDGGGLIRVGLSGREAEASRFIPACTEGGPTCLRHPGLQTLCLGRRHQALFVQSFAGSPGSLSGLVPLQRLPSLPAPPIRFLKLGELQGRYGLNFSLQRWYIKKK